MRTVATLTVLVALLAGCTRTVYVPAAPSPAFSFSFAPAAPPGSTYSPAYSYSPVVAPVYVPPPPPLALVSLPPANNWYLDELLLKGHCTTAGGKWVTGVFGSIHGTCLAY